MLTVRCLSAPSLVFALYNGGPWYVRIDFVEARERKHYESSLPCVTARLGHAPRLQSLKHKQRRDAITAPGPSGQR